MKNYKKENQGFMEKNIKNEVDKQKEHLKKYFDDFLNPSLKENEFTDKQIETINDTIVHANIARWEKVEKERKAKNTESNNKEESTGIENSIQRAFQKLAEEPIEILKLFQSSEGWQPTFDFIISLTVIGALVFLAANKHLDTSQTATLLGGIVGYLLGHTRRR